MIESLKWDSEFFGFKVGKLNYTDESSLGELEVSGNKLIYLFSDKIIPQLASCLVDKKATYIQELSSENLMNIESIQINEFDPKINSYSDLLELAFESGIYSRFYTDKNFINNEFRRLYKRWIDNSLEGLSNYKIFVAEDDCRKLLGFITIGSKNEHLADIGLLAVSSASRGKKIGTKLIEFSKRFAFSNNLKQIQVVTQLQNIPATILYEKTGFSLNEINYIYHIWNHDTI